MTYNVFGRALNLAVSLVRPPEVMLYVLLLCHFCLFARHIICEVTKCPTTSTSAVVS